MTRRLRSTRATTPTVGWLLVLLLSAALAPRNGQAAQTTLPARDVFRLFLLAGQSNMAGRGLVEAPDRVPLPRVLMLDRAGVWVPAVDPMHFDKPIAGVGLGRAFAADVAARHPEVTVGLVPAAVGGSPIDAWTPGAYYPPTRSHPWDDAIARARAAMASGTLDAILWHQGESDATPQRAPAYGRKLEDLIARFRSTLGAPDLPVIVGQLGKFDGAPWDQARRTIDAAHRALPSRVPHTAFVSTEGLKDKGDRLHFDSASLRELGARYAAAYERLARSRP